MTEDVTTTKYAIRICDDSLLSGSPAYSPAGEFAYVNGECVLIWDTERAAELHHDALRELVTPFGISAQYFCAANRVVAVDFVTTAQIRELVAEGAGEREPRTWRYAWDIPFDVRFRKDTDMSVTFERISAERFRMDSDNAGTQLTVSNAAVDEFAGDHSFVEVLP